MNDYPIFTSDAWMKSLRKHTSQDFTSPWLKHETVRFPKTLPASVKILSTKERVNRRLSDPENFLNSEDSIHTC